MSTNLNHVLSPWLTRFITTRRDATRRVHRLIVYSSRRVSLTYMLLFLCLHIAYTVLVAPLENGIPRGKSWISASLTRVAKSRESPLCRRCSEWYRIVATKQVMSFGQLVGELDWEFSRLVLFGKLSLELR